MPNIPVAVPTDGTSILDNLTTPLLFQGDPATAYRDPTAIFSEGFFHLFFTLVETEADGSVYMYVATAKSDDLVHWTPLRRITPRDPSLNFSSPGNVVRWGEEWILCLQTYPRPKGEKYGNGSSRLWILRTADLDDWSQSSPSLLRVKGLDTPIAEMGRMIDPFLVADGEETGKWWCFYKQDGASASTSYDLAVWHYEGRVKAGENVCILSTEHAYSDSSNPGNTGSPGFLMFHSPQNGIGIKRSRDLRHWEDCGFTTLGQDKWPWAQGRLTAGFVLDLTDEPLVGKYLMFFHGSGPEDEETFFDTHASLGIAWSDDLHEWYWPGKS
ncbi:MAG: hypothetical protein V4671_03350 [Armatimonadota bacterium]